MSPRTRGRRSFVLPHGTIGRWQVRVSSAEGDQALLGRVDGPVFVPMTTGVECLPPGSARITWRNGESLEPASEIVTDLDDLQAALRAVVRAHDAGAALDRGFWREVDTLCTAVAGGGLGYAGLHCAALALAIFVERGPRRGRWQRLLADDMFAAG